MRERQGWEKSFLSYMYISTCCKENPMPLSMCLYWPGTSSGREARTIKHAARSLVLALSQSFEVRPKPVVFRSVVLGQRTMRVPVERSGKGRKNRGGFREVWLPAMARELYSRPNIFKANIWNAFGLEQMY